MSNADDIRWVALVALSGDHKAFEKLVCKYQSSIRRFFLNLTMGDVALSDDLSQETFIKVYLSIASFRGLANFSTWLFRIAYNVYYDACRSRKINENLDVCAQNPSFQVVNEFSAAKTDFEEAMSLLRENEKMAVILHFMEEKTDKEIAQIMNCPLGTVKTHIQKGKDKIITYLKQHGYGKKR